MPEGSERTHPASPCAGGLVTQLPFNFSWGGAQQLQQPIAISFLLFTPVIITLSLFAALFEERDAQAVEQGQHGQRFWQAHFETPVLVTADVQDVMQSVFNAPLAPAGVQQSQGWQGGRIAAGDQPHLSGFGFALVGTLLVQAGDLLGPDQT